MYLSMKYVLLSYIAFKKVSLFAKQTYPIPINNNQTFSFKSLGISDQPNVLNASAIIKQLPDFFIFDIIG